MTTTTTTIEKERFDYAIKEACLRAARNGDAQILLSAYQHGFMDKSVPAAALEVAKQNRNLDQLKQFSAFEYPGGHDALNAARGAQGMQTTTAPNDAMARGDARSAAMKALEKAARAIFHGDKKGHEMVVSSMAFERQMKLREQARREPVNNIAATWPV